MKNLIIRVLGLEPRPMKKNIITSEMHCRTTTPENSIPFNLWKRRLKVSSQFTFLNQTHYTQMVCR